MRGLQGGRGLGGDGAARGSLASVEEDARPRSVHLNERERFTRRGRPVNNVIRNTKYTALSFIPLNLMEQFSRFMNQYFLLNND